MFQNEDDRWRLALMRGTASPMTAGMAPTGGAPQDFSGQERQVAAQMAMANQMRGTPRAQGRNVGPSGIYAGPNWGDMAADAANQLAGAYMMKKAGQADAALDEARGLEAARKLAREDAIRAEGYSHDYGMQDDRQEHAVDMQDTRFGHEDLMQMKRFGQETSERLGSQGFKTREREAEEAYKAGEAALDRGLERELEKAGNKAVNSGGAAAGLATSNMDQVINTINNPLLDQAVGFGPGRFAGEFGLGPDGEAVQSLQRNINTVMVDNLVPALKEAELKPVSDTDMKVIKSKFAQLGTQPFGHVEFVTNDYRKIWDRQFDRGIADGTHTQAQKDAYMDRLDNGVIRAAIQWDVPKQVLIQNGVNPEIIAIYEKKLEEQGRSWR